MKIFNFGFKIQNATHADTVKQYEVLVYMAGQSSSAVGIGQFCYRIITRILIIIIERQKQTTKC